MKKIILTLLLAVSLFTLAACGNKTPDARDELTVVFFTSNNNGDSLERLRNIEKNSLIPIPEEPSRQGFTFEGWYADYQLTDSWDFDTDKIGEESMVLYAGWIPTLFNISYELYGGEMITDDYMTEFYAGDSGVLPIAKKAGFSFVAWYLYPWVDESSTIPGDSGHQVLPEGQVQDLVLYAHWKPVSVRVTFSINYPVEGQGPDSISPILFDYGDAVDFPQLENTGTYRFIGWNTRKDGTGDFYEQGEIFERTQRVTLYGAWELID